MPQHLIKEAKLREFVEITKTRSGLLIKGIDTPRDGWEEAFIEAGAKEDTHIVATEEILNKADEEWTW